MSLPHVILRNALFSKHKKRRSEIDKELKNNRTALIFKRKTLFCRIKVKKKKLYEFEKKIYHRLAIYI